MKRLERDLVHDMRLVCGAVPGVVLYRNAQVKTVIKGKWVYGGLGEGTPDIVGFKSVLITPEMVGQRIAVMAGLEAKREDGTGRASEKQKEIIAMWQRWGALAGIFESVDEAKGILGI